MSNTKLTNPGSVGTSEGSCLLEPEVRVATSRVSYWKITRTLLISMTAMIFLSFALQTVAEPNTRTPNSLSSKQKILQGDNKTLMVADNTIDHGGEKLVIIFGSAAFAKGVPGLLLLLCLSVALVNAVATSVAPSRKFPCTLLTSITVLILLSFALEAAAEPNAPAPNSLSSNQTFFYGKNQTLMIEDDNVQRGSSNGNKPGGCGACGIVGVASGSTPSNTIPSLLLLLCPFMALVNAVGSWPSTPSQAFIRSASPGRGNRVSTLGNWALCASFVFSIASIGMALKVLAARRGAGNWM